MPETNGNGVGLTLRELVLEVRNDVKENAEILHELRLNSVSKEAFKIQDQRIHDLEESKLILRGVWLTTTVVISGVAGLAGLVIGSLAYF